jgi:hypothetical protein
MNSLVMSSLSRVRSFQQHPVIPSGSLSPRVVAREEPLPASPDHPSRMERFLKALVCSLSTWAV